MPKASPHPELRRGVLYRPDVTVDGKHIAAAYTHDGVEVAKAIVPNDAAWSEIRFHLLCILRIHDAPLELVKD